MIKYEHLLGKKFIHGRQDCYEIARQFYWDNFGIRLTNQARPEDWWEHGFNLYRDFLAHEGFELVQLHPMSWQVGDAFLMSVRKSVINHAAIYIGNNHILHHFYGRFSEVTPYKGLWKSATKAMIRHPDVPAVSENLDEQDVLDLIPERKREKLRNAIS